MARDVAGLFVCNVLFFAAGAGVTRLLGRWRTLAGLARSIGVVYLAGVAAFGVTLQLLLVLGAPFTRWLVVAVCAVLALSGFAARDPLDPRAHGARIPAYLRPAAVILIVIVALMAVDLWFQPLGVWDAWAQWTAKARSLILFRGLDTELLASPPYRSWNPDYPLLLPSVEAADFTFMRDVNTRAIHMQFWLVYAGFILALLEFWRGRVREVLVWPVVLGVALAPTVQIQTASALADFPVAVFFSLAGLFAWGWLVDADRLALRLFALFAAAALATKFEGRIYVGALAATMLLLIAMTDRSRLRATVAAVAAALVGVVPMSLWVAHHHIVGIFSTSVRERLGTDLVGRISRLPTILESLGTNYVDPSSWLLFAPVVLASLALGLIASRRRVEWWLVAGTLGIATVGLIIVYVATPLDLHGHLRLSARRVVMGPMLFAITLVPLLLESVLRTRRREIHGTQYPLRP